MSTLTVHRVDALPVTPDPSAMYIVKGSQSGDAELVFTSENGSQVRKVMDRSTVLALIAAAFPDTGVVAGTYPKVTVDAKGRVTNGTTLSSGDIPNNAANTSGIASRANILTTIRTINGIGFNGSANITVPAVDTATPRIPMTQRAAANGVATLDANVKVPDEQIPDILLMYSNSNNFPSTGKLNKIYVATNTTYIYRWNGSGYTRLASSLL